MLGTIIAPPTLFTHEKALAVAAELAKSDPDWTYEVFPSEGLSSISVFDEAGAFVAKW